MYDALKHRYSPHTNVDSSKYVTASSEKRSLPMERPVSTLQRVIGKFSALSGLSSGAESPALDRNSYEDVSEEVDDEFGTCFVAAKKLQHKLTKIQRAQASLLKMENEFQNELASWANNVGDNLSKVILKEMANVLKTQRKADVSLLNRKQEIAQMLANVAEKEKSKKRFFDDRIKLKNNRVRIINDYGEKSTKAEKISEELESNYCNLKVLESHYTKAITHGLRNSFSDYSLTLQSLGSNLETSGRMYDELVKAAEFDASNSRNSPSKNAISVPELEENVREPNICNQCSVEAHHSVACQHPKQHRRAFTEDMKKAYPSATRLEADTITLKGMNLGNYNSNESWA